MNGERIPVWIADYVLASYGTGAIMAVPGHDERDFAFARKFGLPIREVVSGGNLDEAAFAGEGVAVHSGFLDGLATPDAKRRMIEWLEAEGRGRGTVTYKLRDWLFSRQRSWGEPFPVLHLEDGSTKPVPDSDLPLLLPELDDFRPSGEFETPLSRVPGTVKFNKGFTCFLIIGAISICLVGSGIAWVITSLLPEAEQSFGLASDDLSLYEHIYLSYRLMAQKDLLKHPADSAGASLSFQVKAGEPVASIASRLEQQGLIDSAYALRDFLVYAGMDRTLLAGEYKLNSRMTPIEIALSLQDATPNEVVFNILPGWRLEEIAASLPTLRLSFAAADFLNLVRGPSIGLLITEDIPQKDPPSDGSYYG